MDTISIGLGELYRPNYKENAWLTLHMAKEIIASQACKKRAPWFQQGTKFQGKIKVANYTSTYEEVHISYSKAPVKY